MIITFAETVLGQVYRVRLDDGTFRGGPAYYVRFGLKSKVMSIITAIFYIIGVGLCIAFMQTNSIGQALSGVSNINPLYIGIFVALVAAAVTIGGVKRLTDISSKIVPVMAGLYILAVVFIIITNLGAVPTMFKNIIMGAFGAKQVFAGLGGYTIMQAFRYGVARGLFSNDAGNGIASMMHASADVDHPAEQGFLGMFGTFVTTIIICTLTAFAIMLTGVLGNGSDGIVLVQDAFDVQFGGIGRWMIFFAMFMFGFTTLIADLFYGETNILLIFKDKYKVPLWIYRAIAFAMFVISTKMDLDIVWGIIDVFVGIIVFINVVTLFLLYKKVKEVLVDYERQKNEGIENPKWEREKEYSL